MEIIVSARHFDLSEALKVASETAVHGALDDLNIPVTSVRVTLDVVKNTHSCTMSAVMKNYTADASCSNIGDMNKAITEAAEKLRVQTKKYLEKLKDHRDRETLNDVEGKEAE